MGDGRPTCSLVRFVAVGRDENNASSPFRCAVFPAHPMFRSSSVFQLTALTLELLQPTANIPFRDTIPTVGGSHPSVTHSGSNRVPLVLWSS